MIKINKLISIVVPVYNVEEYLEKCIDSLLSQTYANLEIILVDDGSTDRSGEICESYKKKDSRIKVIHKKNGGVSSARNEGLKYVSGDYVGFVDSDDFIDVTMYEKLYKEIINNDADVIKCNYENVKNNKILKADFSSKVTVYTRKEAMEDFINTPYAYNKHFKVVVWDALYKRELFDDIKFPEGLLYEDGYVSTKIFFKSKKLVHLDENLYYYRKNDKSIMSQGLTQQSLKSIDDWKEIHFLIKDEIPSCSKQSAYRWLKKYLTVYSELMKRNDIDIDGYYKKYIVQELCKYQNYFKSLHLNKKIMFNLNILNFNLNIYKFLVKNKILNIEKC